VGPKSIKNPSKIHQNPSKNPSRHQKSIKIHQNPSKSIKNPSKNPSKSIKFCIKEFFKTLAKIHQNLTKSIKSLKSRIKEFIQFPTPESIEIFENQWNPLHTSLRVP
jgi:hypothetical protein